jgi:hypothetical protein
MLKEMQSIINSFLLVSLYIIFSDCTCMVYCYLSWCKSMKPPPPRLARCGTVTVRQMAAATAASTAFPPGIHKTSHLETAIYAE